MNLEKNILDLAARQGLSLYTKEKFQGTLDIVPLAPDSERNVVDAPTSKKLQKGDFIFKCVFFSHSPLFGPLCPFSPSIDSFCDLVESFSNVSPHLAPRRG